MDEIEVRLRRELESKLDAEIVYAPLNLCTDNGVMIAYAGALRLLGGAAEDLSITTRPRWSITELAAI